MSPNSNNELSKALLALLGIDSARAKSLRIESDASGDFAVCVTYAPDQSVAPDRLDELVRRFEVSAVEVREGQ